MKQLKLMLAIAGIAIFVAGCASLSSRGKESVDAHRLSDDQKHRLYSAALAASDSPMDTRAFADVCRMIGIFDPHGKPNDQYISFVTRHVDWAHRTETEEFRREIDSKEKAQAYIARNLGNSKE